MRNSPYAVIALSAVALTSCVDYEDWSPEMLARGQAGTEELRLKRGLASYTTYCSGCHGAQGDGQGPGARFLEPKPRDFTKGRVKFASVPANEMPTDADLYRTITMGLHGTSMPSWFLLPKTEVEDIIAYVKTFTPNRKAPGNVIPIPTDPWAKSPEKGVAEGEKLYHGLAACMSCHPAYTTKPKVVEYMKSYDMDFSTFRQNPYDSETKDSEWGAPIRPPDFLVDPVKSGTARADLVRVIATGVGGTAMPAWGATLNAKQLWGLAYYVESLAQLRGSKDAAALRKSLLEQPPYTPPPPPPPPPPPEPSVDPSAVPSASASASAGASAVPTAKPSAVPTATK